MLYQNRYNDVIEWTIIWLTMAQNWPLYAIKIWLQNSPLYPPLIRKSLGSKIEYIIFYGTNWLCRFNNSTVHCYFSEYFQEAYLCQPFEAKANADFLTNFHPCLRVGSLLKGVTAFILILDILRSRSEIASVIHLWHISPLRWNRSLARRFFLTLVVVRARCLMSSLCRINARVTHEKM